MQKSRLDYERVRNAALYMIANNSTLRKVAKKYGISKSTLHKNFLTRLKENDYTIFLQVRALLDKNKAERAYRGGAATKQKYLNIHR